MNPSQAQELRNLVVAGRELADKFTALVDMTEAAIAEFTPGGDPEKRREAERRDRLRDDHGTKTA